MFVCKICYVIARNALALCGEAISLTILEIASPPSLRLRSDDRAVLTPLSARFLAMTFRRIEMKRKIILLLAISIIMTSACASATATQDIQPTAIQTDASPASTSTLEPAPVSSALTKAVALSTVPSPKDDLFTQNGITLPAPACSTLTQLQTEGPYYTANTPERNSLLEEGMTGTRLILVGYVLNQNCQPLVNAWLDFWQADANGKYDNTGYRLRGHQFTDSQGRYYLETILPGLYASRPIEHIHVKIRPEGGAEVTSQLYFPNQPIDGLTVTIEERSDTLVGYFNFVVQK